MIEVILELKPECKIGDNKWKCTIDGQLRIVTYPIVKYILNDLKDIDKSFLLEEVNYFEIKYLKSMHNEIY
jgi:hypothetical protein